MVSAQALLHILTDGKYHSGAALGEVLGVSRAAIWKVIQKIESELGLSVYAVKGKGYRLQQPLELLDKNRIIDGLSKKNARRLNEFEVFFDIESTNQYLNSKSVDGAPSGYLVLAEHQSKGQGRRGRAWVSPFGANLYLSLLWRFQCGAAQLGCLSLFVAVAIARALKKAGAEDIGVKWPNDIYWQDKKLAGILLEMRGELSGPSAVVIGVGLNLSMPSSNTEAKNIDQPWVDLETILGSRVERNDFTALIINSLFDVLNEMNDHQNKLLKEWQQLDILKNKNIEVRFAGKTIHGKGLGINRDGALLVRHNGKELICHSGDVSVRPELNDG